MKQFTIDDFELLENEIEVFLVVGESEKEIIIPRQKFEDWLKRTDRIEYCLDGVDSFGDHEQITGVIPIDAYYSDYRERAVNDLYDYIIINHTDPFDIKPALDKILEHGFSHL